MLAEMGRKSSGKVVVLGAGNELLRDEGVGVHVARALGEEDLAAPVEVIEGGTVLDCLPGDEPISKLVIVDAVYGGGEPGAIYRFSPEDVEPEGRLVSSVHQLGLLDGLWLSEAAGIKPRETVIIGIEPKVVEWGTELSAELEGRICEIVKRVLKETGCGSVRRDRPAG